MGALLGGHQKVVDDPEPDGLPTRLTKSRFRHTKYRHTLMTSGVSSIEKTSSKVSEARPTGRNSESPI